VKLFEGTERRFADEVHFMAVASRVMRQVLVDYARSRSAKKRFGDLERDTWTANLEVSDGTNVELYELIKLDEALTDLAGRRSVGTAGRDALFRRHDCRGNGRDLSQSVHAVRHDLRYAQAWLRRKLTGQTALNG